MKKNLKIATIYTARRLTEFETVSMDMIRWLRISECLADLGYQVDMITNEPSQKIIRMKENLRRLPMDKFEPGKYHVIKTLFQEGFETLTRLGGDKHPFIIAKTTVVDKKNTPGVFFPALYRWRLYSIEKQIDKRARYITVLSRQNERLWKKMFGDRGQVLLIPTGTDKYIPERTINPYQKLKPAKIVIYATHLLDRSQKKINIRLQKNINLVGKLLGRRGIRLCLIGAGDRELLDPSFVSDFGPVPYEETWQYQYFADCGIALAQGDPQNFEASKIYNYLRSGLPIVSEKPIPNNYLISEAKLGLIAPYDDPEKLALLVQKAVFKKWEKNRAIEYIIANHTWEKRVEEYDKLFKKIFLND